jgi:hypothetical protein
MRGGLVRGYWVAVASTGDEVVVLAWECAVLLASLDLVFSDDALVSVHLALDSILRHFIRFGELFNNLVATPSRDVFTTNG